MTKKKTIILSVIAVILISAAVFLFVSPVTVTCSRTVRFYLCGVDGYRALMEMEDGERLEGKFEYIDMSADITVCKSIFRLDTSGGLIINDIHHTIGIYEDDFGYGNAGFTDFRPSRMHSHLAKISNDFDCLAVDSVCDQSHTAEYVYGRLSSDLVTAGDLKKCFDELGFNGTVPFTPFYTDYYED